MSLLLVNNDALPLSEPLLGDLKATDNDKKAFRHETRHRFQFFGIGMLTGFLIQIVSLGAYGVILVRFRGLSLDEYGGFLSPDIFMHTTQPPPTDSAPIFGTDALLYTVLSVLTQIDLVVYVLIWAAFTCTMTRHGMACIRNQFLSKRSKAVSKPAQRRYVFCLGVSFLVGIVLGAFGAWSCVDVYLGFPIPFQPIVATVLLDLALCYLMVWCFDVGSSNDEPKPISSKAALEGSSDEDENSLCDDEGDAYDDCC